MKRSYQVVIHTFSDHTYVIQDANSSEEAESIAEGMLADGEQGEVELLDSFVQHSLPVESEGSD